MGYFQDMGLLFIYSLIVLLWKEPDRTLIFAILWAESISYMEKVQKFWSVQYLL